MFGISLKLLEALCWWLPFCCAVIDGFVSYRLTFELCYNLRTTFSGAWRRSRDAKLKRNMSLRSCYAHGGAAQRSGRYLCSALCRAVNCAVATWPVWTCDCITIHLHNSIYDHYYSIYKWKRERIKETAQLLTVNPFLNFLMALTQKLFKWLCNIFSFFHSHGHRMHDFCRRRWCWQEQHMVNTWLFIVSRIAIRPISSIRNSSDKVRLTFYFNKPTSN